MKPKNKDSKNKEVNQEAVARMRAENSILEQHKNIKIIQFLNIADNSLHQNCAVDINQPIFQPEPKVILFTDYEPLQVLTKVLKLRNRDIVPRRVNIVHPENRLFQVTSFRKESNKSNENATQLAKISSTTSELSNTKVAPGMEVSYLIKFTPEAKVDVSYDLVVITEREKFLVPIRGIGCKAMLDFMDFIDFGEVPVKYKVEKPMILRNVGEKITKWMLKCSSQNISVNKKEGILDVGKSEQIICAFCPQEEGIYEGKMILTYDEYDVTISVLGKSKNDDVRLSINKIKLEDAYITLQSQSIIQIINNTSVPIDFVWKKHPSKEKEEEAKRKVFETLHQKESEEKILNELQFNYEEVVGEDNTSIDLEDSYDEEEIIKINERNHMKSQNIIARRFEKIKKSLIEDQICFEDDNFQLEPISGKIWPNTQMSINITFKPEKSKLYKSKAYCDVTGLDKRLKLKMIGTGIGPKAKLSFNEVNLLDIAITDKKTPIEQKLVITNIGVIDCEFEIESPNTPCAKQIHFKQNRGVIRARSDKDSGELSIPIDFYAERLGEFSEKFLVRIIKSGTVLPVVFKGHVIAPFCKFSKERIDFAKVSLGFNSYETVDLINCSKVSIEYNLRISTDAKDAEKIETIFIIDKKNGVIHPDQVEKIKIQFKPEDERSYDVVILMDMVGIGFDMLTLPVTAVCEIPEVIIEPSTMLDFGDVFIRKEEYRKIRLTNTSTSLCAQFHVMPQDESSKSWGIIMCEAESGVIEPEQTFTLNVALKAVRLNKISLKLEIRCKTKNSDKDSSYISTINVLAFSNGPSVKVDNDRNDFDFGTVEVLKEKEQKITLFNVTPIEAFYTAFMKNTNSIFKIKEKTGKINKNDSITLIIVCKPDDNLKFLETMYFKIDEGKDFEITLRCKGEGTTIVIPNEVKNINFGTMFTMKEKEIPLYFENRGRSPLYIYWVPRKNIKKKIADSDKNQNTKKDQEEEEIIFNINHMKPPKPLGPKRCFDFIMKAFSKNKGFSQEIFDVFSRKESENTGIKITESVVVTAHFIEPKLEFFPPHKLNFNYSFDKDYDKDYISKTLTIKNAEELRAEFTASASPMFKIDREYFIIEPHQSETIRVDFVTTQCKQKKKIDTLYGTINIEHKNHDSIEVYPLEVSINFPNLKDMPSEINFGCLLNDTFSKKLLTLESNSDLEVTYEWILIELENSYESIKKTRQEKKIPLNEIFSIVPMNGKLRSGETETAEITFIPGPNSRYNAIARCIVEGGPEYDVKLIGEASEIKYKIIANEGTEVFEMPKGEIKIAFGEIPFNVASKIDMVIKNDGEVSFSYKISYVSDKMRYLSLSSYHDTIPKGDSKKIYIEMIPGIPDFVEDEINIEIAHFEPIKVKIRAIGIYHGIIFSLNRLETDFQERMFEARSELELRRKKGEEYYPKKKAPLLPQKTKIVQDQKKSVTVSPSEMSEIEMEANRKILSKRLTEKISKGEILNTNIPTQPKILYNKSSFSAAQREQQLAAYLKDIKVATYTCDLGNIIAGRSFDYNFNVYNYNKVPLMFMVDKKLMTELGYIISTNSNNDRVYLDPYSMVTITVTHKTNSRNLEKVSQILKFMMRDGETYEVELNSYVTIPELKISSTNIEFNKVYIGRKKVVKFRIENIRQVTCKWRIDNKDAPSKQSEREEKREDKSVFYISQTSGKLEPGKKQTLVAYFIPTKEKEYTNRYAFVIEESSRPIEFFLKGRGQTLGLEIIPDTVDIGPVLPYFKYAYNFIELYNPNEIDIEVYSIDFDNQYIKEEEIIRNYKALAKNFTNALDLPIRLPGEPIWDKLGRYYQSYTEQIANIKSAVEKYNDDPNVPPIELTDKHIEKLDLKIPEEEEEIKMIPAIDRGDKYNIILIGPQFSGKSTICKEQRKHHFRGIISVSNLLEWNQNNKFQHTVERVKVYLDERKKELEAAKVEREKLMKHAKNNRKIKFDDTPIDEKKYGYLSKDIMVELLKNRLSQEDCNVGVIFDDLESHYVENQDIMLEVIDEALKDENIILAYFDFPRDENGEEVCNFIEWNKRPKKIIKEEKQEEKSKNKSKDKRRKSTKPKIISKPSERISVKPTQESKSQTFLDSLLKEYNKSNDSRLGSPKNWPVEEKNEYMAKRDRMIHKITLLNDIRLKEYEEQKINFDNDSHNKSLNINSSLVLENVSKIPTYPSIVNQSTISLRPVERISKRVEFEYQIVALLNSYLESIPKPSLPDPEDLPTPPDEEFQMVKKPPIRPDRLPINSFFIKGIHSDYAKSTIDEIIQLLIDQDKKLEEYKLKEAQAQAAKEKQKTKNTNVNKGKEAIPHVAPIEFKMKDVLIDQTRWILKRNERVRLLVGFYTKEVGKKTQPISFEVMTYPPIQKKVHLNGIADYPSLSTNPMNIKMSKPGTIGLFRNKKNYIEEDFGPILITRDDKRVHEKYKDTNCKVLRFTNNGQFDVKVDFVFLSSLNLEGLGFPIPFLFGSQSDQMEATSNSHNKVGSRLSTITQEPITPFILTKNTFDIKKDETILLDVYTFPNRPVEYKDELICLIKDNPQPIRISLSCRGVEPKYELESDYLDFEKAIINQPVQRQIRIKNISEVTCKWQLVNPNKKIPTQLKFDPVNGIIEKNREVYINVTYCSEVQEIFNYDLNLEVEDNLGYGVKAIARNIKFKAEAFKVNVIINNDNKTIDFGNVKVKDYKSVPFTLKNLGIYKIKYKFDIIKKSWQDLFKFEPPEGEIEPNKEKNMLAIFLPHPKEININQIKNGSELKLYIYEGEKNIKYQEVPIFVNVASHFSKYTLNPTKVINYGSMQYGETQVRSIEIRNEGQFDFTYEISEFLDEITMKKIKEEKDLKEIEEQKAKEHEMKEALEAMGKNVKKDHKKQQIQQQQLGKNQKKIDEGLKISRFVINNFKGIVAPGSSAKIDIKFQAEGKSEDHKTIAIDIQGRQPDDHPLGIPFDLIGESCIPGIETKDFDNIFEEQTVLTSLRPDINKQTVITSGIFATEENVFWFGTVIASKNPNGVSERFKLINNNKIPCTVRVNVKTRNNTKSEDFEVAHKTPLKIYPNESEYVSVTFKPKNVIPYSGYFEAIVEGGELNKETGILSFELRGECTLPSILLQSPQEFDTDGTPIIRFKKTRISKTSTAQIVLKNEGVVPATVKFDPIVNPCFNFDSSKTATIQPKNYQTFDIQFEPKNVGLDKTVLQYRTLYNPYENPKLYLMGEGYFEPISIDNLLNDNELNYGDICIGNTKTFNFTISNHSENVFRFNWLNLYEPNLELVPSIGIILPKTTKTIQASFYARDCVKYVLKDLYVEIKMIKFTNQMEDWDNSKIITRKVTQSELQYILAKKQEDYLKRKEEIEILINTISGNKGKASITNKKSELTKKITENIKTSSFYREEANINYDEVMVEPSYTVIEKSEKYNSIKLTAVSDYSRYECKIKEIKFKPTTMYESRKHEFQLRNISAISLHYNFSFVNPNTGVSTNQLSTSNALLSMFEKSETGPFSVYPKSHVIPANSDDIITVRFSPTEIDDNNFRRLLVCNIKDLDPSMKELQIELSGDAERPLCHFELQEGIRHENGLRIVEFESIGMMVKNTKRFFVLNPTNQGYEFEWEELDAELIPSINKVFKCLTPKGVIFSGKKFEMIFEYIPNSLSTHESYWNFKINSEKIFEKFLFVGITREPMILFNVNKINFGPLLLGGKNKEIIQIVNEEHLPYKFIFDKDSIKGNNTYGDSMIVSPMSGTLMPKSSTPIEVTFMPRVEKEFNYNLVLKVKQRMKHLSLNVKGVGYTISHGVYLDNKPELKLLAKQDHLIDFGEFFINEHRTRSIIIKNNGSFNFHFAFKKNGAEFLKITPENDTVKKNSEMVVTLTILPLNKLSMHNHKIFLQIVSGPTYCFVLNARARFPQIVFSSVSCNFGPVCVMRQPQPTVQIITVKNMDKEALTIETNFDNKNKPYLDVLLSTGQVILPFTTPGDILEIPIVFIPRDFVKYRDLITFKFNGIYDVDVEVTGEGIPVKVELEEPSMQTLDFGIIQQGQSRKLNFNVVNRGKSSVNLQFYPDNPMNFSKKCLALTCISEELSEDHKLENKIFVAEPRDIIRFEVLFNPNIRIASLSEDIVMKINNCDVKRIVMVKGASYGVDVKLVGDIPTFGSVVAKSMTIRQVVLRNFGDIPAKFKWEQPTDPKRDYTKFFTFVPSSGVIPAHDDINLEIIFHPKEPDNNIAFEKIKCFIDNGDKEEPLFLTLSLYGKSIDIPNELVTEQKIETFVRTPLVKEIKIKNPTEKLWRITPSISSSVEQYVSYFKGHHLLEIKPNSEGIYNLTYLPLTMSKLPSSKSSEKVHDATAFFPLPDGSARVFKFYGISIPPKPKDIQVEVKAREWKIIPIMVNNWLYQTQRFKVSFGENLDQGIFLKGANTIDIASNSTKEYKLSFRSWKELQCTIPVTFENVDSKEFVVYLLHTVVSQADPYSVTELIGIMREVVTSTITIANPLKIPVLIQPNQIYCDNEYVIIKPNSFKIIPESEIPIEISFRPLVETKLNANIVVKSPELGEMKYPLVLKGLSGNQIKPLQPIVAYLGSDKIINFKFIHYLKKQTVYSVKVEKLIETNPAPIEFIPETPTIIAPVPTDPLNGLEVTSSIKYEPYTIYESKAILKVSSPEGGEYCWLLIGQPLPPQAQGPYKIPLGKSFTLDFRNPLNEPCEINARFDNPNFSFGGKINNRIESKALIKITIVYRAGQDSNNTGRLIITLNKLPPWVYYLQAE